MPPINDLRPAVVWVEQALSTTCRGITDRQDERIAGPGGNAADGAGNGAFSVQSAELFVGCGGVGKFWTV